MKEGVEVVAKGGLVWVTIYRPEGEAIRMGLQAEHAVGIVQAIEEALETIRRAEGDVLIGRGEVFGAPV